MKKFWQSIRNGLRNFFFPPAGSPRWVRVLPYAVLGIAPDASPEEIKKAYKELAGKYHPDKVHHLGDDFQALAEKRFKEIQEAYHKLTKK